MPHTKNPLPETSKPVRRRLRLGAAAGVGALAITALIGGPAFAGHGLVSLAGSNFEIDTNANLKVDHAAPSIDWASVNEIRQPDLESGSGDDSFGQGAKEDTPVPTVVDGSIPPNKSDLLNFGLYLEEAAAGDFLHLFWHRVQEPSGTTNMDFEFNQSETTSANGVTPVRTEGDLLIQYDLAQGGTNPKLFIAYWLTDSDFDGTSVSKADCVAANALPCWGLRQDLSAAGDATGSINTSAIPAADSDGLGNVSARTFGEATIDFGAIAGSGCVSFGSAYLKSRSSDSFTAALKDFIAPTETGLNNCGVLKIVKTKKHAEATPTTQPHAGVVFTVTGTGFPAGGTQYSTDANGEICITGLEPGNYGVAETVPTGYAVTSTNPQTGVVVADSTCATATAVTFTNMPLTNITVSVDSQIPGGTASTIDCDAAADPPFEATTGTGGDGSLTKSNLLPGTYTCVIIIDP
ncbi:prealbumin-like fold domain-containing protein [Agromyces sp. NPDC049794]|uniref:MSCRAMM family protein n=1 Tax=unclassified Agromyces TaxID=2639701 RepID=UPI0033DF9E3D